MLYLHQEKLSVRFLSQALSLVTMIFVLCHRIPGRRQFNYTSDMVDGCLHAWNQDHSYYWTVVLKDKSANVYVMAKSGVSNASHSPDQPYLSKHSHALLQHI